MLRITAGVSPFLTINDCFARSVTFSHEAIPRQYCAGKYLKPGTVWILLLHGFIREKGGIGTYSLRNSAFSRDTLNLAANPNGQLETSWLRVSSQPYNRGENYKELTPKSVRHRKPDLYGAPADKTTNCPNTKNLYPVHQRSSQRPVLRRTGEIPKSFYHSRVHNSVPHPFVYQGQRLTGEEGKYTRHCSPSSMRIGDLRVDFNSAHQRSCFQNDLRIYLGLIRGFDSSRTRLHKRVVRRLRP